MSSARFRRFRSIPVVLAILLLAGSASPSATAAAPEFNGEVYFLLADNGSEVAAGPRLVPVARTLDATIPATTAIRELLEGPASSEETSHPGISSAIPAGTRLRSISISKGVATVDLSREFVSGGGTLSMTARLAQVVFTLTQFPTVDGVAFRIQGVPTTVFGGEGVIVDVPARRGDFAGLAPSILLEQPAYGGRLGNPARLTGIADVFEAIFWVAIVDGDGRILAEKRVMASAGTGAWGRFDVTIRYDLPAPQWGSVITWYASPRDGTRVDVREYPVELTAGGWCGGARATLLGTEGPDLLLGTGGRDVVVSFGGADRVRAGAGDDVVCGGSGRDRILGEGGADRLYGEGGDDVLRGGTGNDRLAGGPGRDDVAGGGGADTCSGEIRRGCP